MKDIVIISNYIHLKNEVGNSRFLYLANRLKEEKVEIITSTFYHKTKKQRNLELVEEENYKVKLIYEPGYTKNISIQRIYSNIIIARNIIKYLKTRKKPDVIYCAIPPTTISKKVARFAKRNNIKLIIDIQDLWPEAYKMVFNVPVLSNILFFPIKKQADYTYKNANAIVAVSNTYLKRAADINKIATKKISVFLGTDLKAFDKYKKEKEISNNVNIVYIGTLGNSYNLKCIMDAIKKIDNQMIKFVVIGDGVLRQEFEEYAKKLKINYEFTGNLPYNEMVERLCKCDIAVNPIKNGSAGSIINKVGDYAAAGLPIINTQECQEYRDLIEKYEIGYNCENNDIDKISEKIQFLIDHPNIREKMGKNNRKLAEEKFDRNVTYNEIINLIKEV